VIARWMQRNPFPVLAGIVLFILLTSGAGWLRSNMAETIRLARQVAAGLLMAAAYAIVVLTARAVTGRAVPLSRPRDDIDLSPEPDQPWEMPPEPSHRDPGLATVVYPGRRPLAGPEPELAPETRQEVPK